MRKRVLLAEESDTVRGVAESTLRQNGFEVVSVGSGEKAIEVLQLSKPDIIIVGSELMGKGRVPVWEHCQEDPRASSVPLLLLADPGHLNLPFPQEVVIHKPFEPKELLDKVRLFAGSPSPAKAAAPAAGNPLGDAQLEDELLDAALGLDQIDVTDSEVMDKTQVPGNQKKAPKTPEKVVGFDHYGDEDGTDSGRVESLMIRDEHAEIGHSNSKAKGPDAMSSSGKLEILNDQYGLIDHESVSMEPGNRAHDYNWFVNEMQKDATSLIGSAPTPAKVGAEPGSGGLSISEPSSMVDPVTPPATPSAPRQPAANKPPGVDKFIDEFKKEMDKIRSDEPESITINDGKDSRGAESALSWQDSLEKMTPEQVGVFTRQFVRELADRIAQLIVAKIDEDKLLTLLKREIINQIKKTN